MTEDEFGTAYLAVCDIIERGILGVKDTSNPDFLYTSGEARAAALKIFNLLDIWVDED